MAGGLGQYFCQLTMNKLFGAQDFTPPATWYVALMTALPNDAGGGSEVSTSGTGYARVALTNNTANFPSADSTGRLVIGVAVNFGTATTDWGTIVGVAIYDAATAGNLGPWGPLTVQQLVIAGAPFAIASGNAVLTQG